MTGKHGEMRSDVIYTKHLRVRDGGILYMELNLELLPVQGKKITVSQLTLTYENGECLVSMCGECDGIKYDFCFINASVIKVEPDGNGFVIEGFEIIDNKSRGWESDKRYFVNDYEYSAVSFYCEDFTITENV